MTHRFLTPAIQELKDAVEYYESQITGLGADFIDELDIAVERIKHFPEAWSFISRPFRQCKVRRFPYLIVYTQTSLQEILIVSIFHQHREPSSWKDRLK